MFSTKPSISPSSLRGNSNRLSPHSAKNNLLNLYWRLCPCIGKCIFSSWPKNNGRGDQYRHRLASNWFRARRAPNDQTRPLPLQIKIWLLFDCLLEVVVPFLEVKRKALHLDSSHPSLAIFDCFKGHTTPEFYTLLKEHNILSIQVPANCTDQLQPLDVSVNKPVKDHLR